MPYAQVWPCQTTSHPVTSVVKQASKDNSVYYCTKETLIGDYNQKPWPVIPQTSSDWYRDSGKGGIWNNGIAE